MLIALISQRTRRCLCRRRLCSNQAQPRCHRHHVRCRRAERSQRYCVSRCGLVEIYNLPSRISGSMAERLPILHLVGLPSTRLQGSHALLHHTLGNGSFDTFAAMSSHLVATVGILRQGSRWTEEVDRVMGVALTEVSSRSKANLSHANHSRSANPSTSGYPPISSTSKSPAKALKPLWQVPSPSPHSLANPSTALPALGSSPPSLLHLIQTTRKQPLHEPGPPTRHLRHYRAIQGGQEADCDY